MPKLTFYRLNEAKRNHILDTLKREYEEKPFCKCSVQAVIEATGISRGSFYQYFEDLKDSYFTVLRLTILDAYQLFCRLVMNSSQDFFTTMREHDQIFAEHVFAPSTYKIYRNYYLYWTRELDMEWQNFMARFQDETGKYTQSYQQNSGRPGEVQTSPTSDSQQLKRDEPTEIKMPEHMHFTIAIMNDLMQRTFLNDWDKETFIYHYHEYLHWLENGIAE